MGDMDMDMDMSDYEELEDVDSAFETYIEAHEDLVDLEEERESAIEEGEWSE
jgi:hypothetical protein